MSQSEAPGVVLTGIAGNYALLAETDAMLVTLKEIQELVSWHMDAEAQPEDESPDDMTAHVNGLVWQLCQRHTNPLTRPSKRGIIDSEPAQR